MEHKGVIYILTNPSFPQFVKIGYADDVEERLTCSLGGGGRYNKIITDFISDGNTYPAVGLSFGLEPIYTILKEQYEKDNLIDVYIIPMDTEVECIKLADNLRKNNINVLV